MQLRCAADEYELYGHVPASVRPAHQASGVRVRVDAHAQPVTPGERVGERREIVLHVHRSTKGSDGAHELEPGRRARVGVRVVERELEVAVESVAISRIILAGGRLVLRPGSEGKARGGELGGKLRALIAAARQVDVRR